MAEPVGEDGRPGADLVQVAFAGDEAEGEMIRGLLEVRGIACLLQPIGLSGPTHGLEFLPPGARGVMVRAGEADAARRLLDEVLSENAQDTEAEIANAVHLEEASGRKPRRYGLIGAYVRASILSVGIMGLIFAVFLLLRGV